MNWLSNKNLTPHVQQTLVLIPTAILCFFLAFASFEYPLHDYCNNYFPALLLHKGIAPESVVFDIFDFNSFIWSQGYPDEIADFYLNSPFISTFFYPLSFLSNAVLSKLIFNLISIVLFLVALKVHCKNYFAKKDWPFLLLIPFFFYVPIRNNIVFGQLYLLIAALTLLGYHLIVTNKKFSGEALLSLSVFIKIFPLFYLFPLIFGKQLKPILRLMLTGVSLLAISIFIGGWGFWQSYLFDVLPNAISNESTVDFRSNAQSIDVFLKTLLVRDSYYNPTAIFNNVLAYKLIALFCKTLIWAIAITLSFKHKESLLKVLSVWVVALFLTQTRTATYAQILWVIPALELIKSNLSLKWKLVFAFALVAVCNLPIHWLGGAPMIFEFTRLWFSILLAILFFSAVGFRWTRFFYKSYLILLLPMLVLTLLKTEQKSPSSYVLEPNDLFFIHDFSAKNNTLIYHALGANGNEVFQTDIRVASFDILSLIHI